jgi:hypothetical protein
LHKKECLTGFRDCYTRSVLMVKFFGIISYEYINYDSVFFTVKKYSLVVSMVVIFTVQSRKMAVFLYRK